MSVCIWTRELEDATYDALCGNHGFYFEDGTLRDHPGFKFCPYCGNEIECEEPEEAL